MPTYERHVLFVDDDIETRATISALLAEGGVRVTIAGNGEEALQRMREGLNPDLIITDIEMPRMDGFAFLEAVRANDAWLPIPFMILTHHAEKATIRRAMVLGVDDYLIKPVDEERLLLTIYNRTKRIQELTRYAEAEHEKLFFVRRDMARMFTHELSTPLVSLNIVAELLGGHVQDLTSDAAQELVEALKTGIARLNRLLDQMKLLIQLDTGERLKLIRETAQPGPLWDALTTAVSKARAFSYRQRDVPLRSDQSKPGGEVVAHWESLAHALAELLSNAMAFSPEGSEVQVTQWTDRERAYISIRDSGPGIPEAQRRDLFRRFQQVEREKHDQQGIGMGLYLARNLVEAHGGTLILESTEGAGTTVTVSLPLLAPKRAAPVDRPPQAAETPPDTPPRAASPPAAVPQPAQAQPSPARPGTGELRAAIAFPDTDDLFTDDTGDLPSEPDGPPDLGDLPGDKPTTTSDLRAVFQPDDEDEDEA